MDQNGSGGDADNFDWDTEDELEIDNYAIASRSGVSLTNGEAVLGTAEVSSSADSPNSKLIDHFVGMGFSQELVTKAIEENGEENSNLILEALLQYSASSLASSSNSKLIDHFVGMGFSEEMVLKAVQENGEGNTDTILETLLTYSALEKSAPVQQHADSDDFSSDYEGNFLDDFTDIDSSSDTEEIINPGSDEESKLLYLTKMGYSEAEASVAMERCGPDSSIAELTDFICAAQMAKAADALFPVEDRKPFCNGSNYNKRRNLGYDLWKRKKQMKLEKKLLNEVDDALHLPNPMIGFGVPTEPDLITQRTLPEAAVGPPYFYYENVALAPKGVWSTISRFLYDVEPEFVDSKFFCAAARKRGYIHNLPIENRFPLLPFPPRTIHEAFPLTRKWWPSWDPRTKLNCIQTCTASARLTERIRKALEAYDGEPPLNVQKYVLDECRKWNLVWVGRNKVAPLEADEVEMLLGFPKNHTRGGGMSRTDRYKSLGNSFQVDTVAYHLSVLKDMFPGGINLLSLFSGIGGAEVALHRLGIPLKNVVSVEISEVNRNIVRGWWEQTNQRGTLIDIADVQELNGDRLEGVDDMTEKTEFVEEPVVEGEMGTDMVEEGGVLEEKSVLNVTEQTEDLEYVHAAREIGNDMAEPAEDSVMEEESEKEEDTELGNEVEGVEKEEEREAEMGDTVEAMEAADDTEMPETTEELEMEAAEETEDTEEIEEDSKASGGKRKRGKKLSTKVPARAPSRKKVEEDVCFICFDGGNLVLCDRRGCPKAYHSACVGRDEAFFQSKGKWNCGWHLCSNCKKNAHYMCFTCTFSLCKGCIKEAVILCIRGNKGFCESCMNLVMLIEKEQQAQIDFDDRGSWEYLFKDYWIDLKSRLSITSDELAQAKNPWKGAAKQESPIELHGFNDAGGSDSDSSSGNVEVTVSKRRKTRSQSKARATEGDSPSTMAASAEGASADENAEWASKELLEVVMNMRNGDKSVLSRMELSQLILDYIQKYKLRDRRNKSYVICDMRLKNLFGKPRVGHIEMLNLLDPHIFFTKEDSQTDDLQGSVVDAEANQLEADWNSDALTKTGKDKKRKTRKKGDARGLQSNVDDYAAIDMHNISLIYLRRNLVEELLEDTETFHDKVVDSFVKIRISGAGQKQDLYRLVQVVGTSKVAEPYRVGKRTTDFLLDILNLNKTEAISIDIISNQEFTEDECKRLRQSIKCGLINRLTVGDIQEKAMTIQAVRVKDWVESEITRLSHLRDRASDLGRRKELRECVEKLQILKTPEELQRRLEEIPEIHVDPNMDPSYESEEEDEDDKKQGNYMRPRGSSFNRRGREPISPRKGGYSSTDSWSGGRNYSSMNRELIRNLSGKGFTSKGDDSIGASETGNENLCNLGRERETQQPNSWSKPKMALSSEIGTRNTHSVVIQEPSLKVASEISPAPPSIGVTTNVQVNETEKMWHYQDPSGKVQGPFSIVQLRKWSNTGYFPADLKIWKTNETQDDSILLTNALAGKFQKDPPVVDNSLPKAQMALYGNSLGAASKQGIESQVGERSRLDQHRVAWSPQRVLASPGQTDISSSAVRPAPSSLEIPKHSRDTWGSDTNLPSPTPNQNPTGGNKGQAFESKWSPTPGQSSGPLPVPNPFRGGAVGLQPPTVVSESGSPAAPVVHSHPMVSSESHRRQVNVQASVNLGADLKNAGVSIQNLVQSLSSNNPPAETHGPGSVSVSRQEAVSVPSMPATGTQRWTNASTQKHEPNPSLAMPAQPAAYSHWNDASQASQFPGVFQTPGQPNMVPSESWRPAVPVQSNVQLPAPPNLPWGMTVPDNQGTTALRQAPGNQNPGWGPIPGNQNMGWGAPVPANTNMNWGPSSQGSASVNPNQNWAPPGQRQVPGNANPGWSAPGNTIQGWTPPGQGPTGWVAPGQGAAPGNANPGYPTPSRNSSMWGGAGAGAGAGAEPNHNGDKFSDQRDRSSQGNESGFGGAKPWNRQSSFGSGGGGSSRPPFKGQRVCKFHENGHCKKGASCDYMHT